MREERTARRAERWVRVGFWGKGEKICILVNNSQQGHKYTYELDISFRYQSKYRGKKEDQGSSSRDE